MSGAAVNSPQSLGPDFAFRQLLSKLDADQRQVANWIPTGRALRVVAGAGAGKTSAITALAAKLLRDKRVDPTKLIVTTFTNKAATEVQNRIRDVCPSNLFAPLRVATFHGLALRAMGEGSVEWDMKRNVDMAGMVRARDIPSAQIIWRQIVNFGTVAGTHAPSLKIAGMESQSYARAVDVLRARGIEDPADKRVAEAEREFFLPHLADAYRMYKDAKAALTAWDFGDLLAMYLQLLKRNPGCTGGNVVLVDEAQDNNWVQLEIAQALSQAGGSLLLVGDGRQGVHLWRGAYPELFLEADKVLGAESLYLTNNYRSIDEIVQLGNTVAARYPWALGHAMQSARGRATKDEQFVRVKQGLADATVEAEWIAADIESRCRVSNLKGGDFAVLTRTNAALIEIQAALEARNIATQLVGENSLFSSREMADVLNYAVLCRFGSREMAQTLLHVANRPARFLGHEFSQNFMLDVVQTNSITASLRNVAKDLKTGPRKAALDFAQLLERCHREPDWRNAIDRIGDMLVSAAQERRSDGPHDPDEDAPGAYAAIIRVAKRFNDVSAFLTFAQKCKETKTVQGERQVDPNKVILSTTHRSKGLEFPHVYLQATEGVLPHKKSTGGGDRKQLVGTDIESELRCFYVGVTRAKDSLTMTTVGHYDPRKATGGPSRFLYAFMPHVVGTLDQEEKERQRQKEVEATRKAEERKNKPKPPPAGSALGSGMKPPRKRTEKKV